MRCGVWGVCDLNVPSAEHDAVHLFERELCGLGDLVLHEGEPLVLLRDGVPRHVDGLDGAERQERQTDRVLLQLERDRTHVHPAQCTYTRVTNTQRPTEIDGDNGNMDFLYNQRVFYYNINLFDDMVGKHLI